MSFTAIVKKYGRDIFPKIDFHSKNILLKIEKCRTPELGGHIFICEDCKTILSLNNSCSNRNCPVCQGNKRKRWIEKQCESLIKVPYFHVVFTVPDVLNRLFRENQKECYNLLFATAWETLKTFFENDKSLVGKGGMLCILHTWGQTLSFHPHLHCLVPAAGLNQAGEFKLLRGKNKFLFNVKSLGEVFRAKFAAGLTALHKKNVLILPDLTRKLMFWKNWIVYSQRPFSTPENVVRYIGMYSHRVALSENRIIEEKDGNVSFFYKDYKDEGKKKIMTLTGEEFLRRFSMHILPYKLMKIRYFGQLNNRHKKHFIKVAEKAVGLYCSKSDFPENRIDENQLDFDLDDEPISKKNSVCCPNCKSFNFRKLASFAMLKNFKELVLIDIEKSQIYYNTRDGPQKSSSFILIPEKSL